MGLSVMKGFLAKPFVGFDDNIVDCLQSGIKEICAYLFWFG